MVPSVTDDDIDFLLAAAYERQGYIADLQRLADEAVLDNLGETDKLASVIRQSIRRERQALDALLPSLPASIRPLFITRGGEKLNANDN